MIYSPQSYLDMMCFFQWLRYGLKYENKKKYWKKERRHNLNCISKKEGRLKNDLSYGHYWLCECVYLQCIISWFDLMSGCSCKLLDLSSCIYNATEIWKMIDQQFTKSSACLKHPQCIVIYFFPFFIWGRKWTYGIM